MKTHWEYKVVEFESPKAYLPANRHFDGAALEAQLNAHGAEGWELVSILDAGMCAQKFAATLKRPVNSNS